MKKEDFAALLTDIDDEHILDAEAFAEPKSRRIGLRIAALAACLCLVLTAVILPLLHNAKPQEPMSPIDTAPPHILLGGTMYVISPHLEMSDELPEGFSYAGTAPAGGFDACDYYTNPAMPEWVYVHQQVYNNITGETPMKYVRYVDQAIRGKDFVCVHNALYVSLWSISPDEAPELYSRAEETYGIRIEGDAPEGFISLGNTDFSGHDTIPAGTLASNTGTEEALQNPAAPDILLVSTAWHTAPDENGEQRHTGWNVYIRYK